MRIAFHAPMKSPNHPVPSGDRQMARLLVKALEHAGHTVELASELRSYCNEPDDSHYDRIEAEAAREVDRLSREWRRSRPDLWFTYHPYYKSPDLLGPLIARAFRIPYATAEASYSARRNVGRWARTQASVGEAVRMAAVNICFTERDRLGLEQALPDAKLERLPPFVDVFTPTPNPSPQRGGELGGNASESRSPLQGGVRDGGQDRPIGDRLITVAMMRPGDKMESYRMLARALKGLLDLPWTLSIIGDGPCRNEVAAEFAAIPQERIEWHGELAHARVAAALSDGAIYLWPGFGEAFGLAYLEAQAAGLAVVAQAVAGVPEVVKDGVTGLLTTADDIDAYADAIRRLLTDTSLCEQMREAARRFVVEERSLPVASARLDEILQKAIT